MTMAPWCEYLELVASTGKAETTQIEIYENKTADMFLAQARRDGAA